MPLNYLKNMALLKVAERGDHSFRSVRMAPLYDAVTTRVVSPCLMSLGRSSAKTPSRPAECNARPRRSELRGMKSLLEFCARPVGVLRENWWALPLRLIVGYGFMEHGFAKLARGPDSFIGILHALHMPAAPLLAWATILTELIGGCAVLLGAFVSLVSIPMAVVLLVATFTVHLPYGFSSIKLEAVTSAGAHFGQPGYETDVLYLACLAALVLGGSGPLALDNLPLRRGVKPTC